MQTKKSFFILVLAFILFIGMTACGSGTETTTDTQSSNSQASTTETAGQATTVEAAAAAYGDVGGLKLPIVNEPVTITWLLSSEVQGNLSELPVIKELEKRTGVKVDIQYTAPASYLDKLKIVLASGKLPDITEGLTKGEYNTLGDQGAVAAINQYMDMLPNFKKLYADTEENKWVLKSYANTEGNLYTWPIYDLNRDVNFGFHYRKDIFDKNGIKPWTNTEEFYQAMKKLKEIYPNSYPIVSKAKEKIFYKWRQAWGLNSEGENDITHYDSETKSWEFIYTQPEYKEMLDFMKKLYNEGLLDPEFMTCTTASYNAKLTADDQGFAAWDWIGWMQIFYNQVKEKNPDFDLRYGLPIGPTGKIAPLRKVTDFGLVIAKNDNTETCLKLLDYLTSPSGSELITLGIEGVQYNMVDNKPVYPELKDLPTIGIMDLESRYGAWLESMYVRVDHRSVYFNFTPREQEAQDLTMKENRLEAYPPLLVFTAEESEIRAEYESSLLQASAEFSAKYVMDKAYGDAQWNEWVSSTEKLGIKSYLYVFNTAQKRYDATK